jgi:hypothetical protein
MGTAVPTAAASRADNGVLRADNGAAAASGRFMVRSEELTARRVTTSGRIGMRVGRAFEQRVAVARAKTKYANTFVMPGLDPGIHRSSQKFF